MKEFKTYYYVAINFKEKNFYIEKVRCKSWRNWLIRHNFYIVATSHGWEFENFRIMVDNSKSHIIPQLYIIRKVINDLDFDFVYELLEFDMYNECLKEI